MYHISFFCFNDPPLHRSLLLAIKDIQEYLQSSKLEDSSLLLQGLQVSTEFFSIVSSHISSAQQQHQHQQLQQHKHMQKHQQQQRGESNPVDSPVFVGQSSEYLFSYTNNCHFNGDDQNICMETKEIAIKTAKRVNSDVDTQTNQCATETKEQQSVKRAKKTVEANADTQVRQYIAEKEKRSSEKVGGDIQDLYVNQSGIDEEEDEEKENATNKMYCNMQILKHENNMLTEENKLLRLEMHKFLGIKMERDVLQTQVNLLNQNMVQSISESSAKINMMSVEIAAQDTNIVHLARQKHSLETKIKDYESDSAHKKAEIDRLTASYKELIDKDKKQSSRLAILLKENLERQKGMMRMSTHEDVLNSILSLVEVSFFVSFEFFHFSIILMCVVDHLRTSAVPAKNHDNR